MVSPTAISDIRRALADGVPLTPEDIIRLNALGLRHDYSKDGADLSMSPRLAWLGDVAFREPAVGHELWMDEVADVFNLDLRETRLKVRAFCLATAPDALPDTADRKACADAVRKFCKERLADYTLGQVEAALVYAEYGYDVTAMVHAEPPQERRNARRRVRPDGEWSYAVGTLRLGVSLKLGTPSDLRRMTLSGLESLIDDAFRDDPKIGKRYREETRTKAFAAYKRTLDAIIAERKAASDPAETHAEHEDEKHDSGEDQADDQAASVAIDITPISAHS